MAGNRNHIGAFEGSFCPICNQLEDIEKKLAFYKKVKWFQLKYRSRAWLKMAYYETNSTKRHEYYEILRKHQEVYDSHPRCSGCTILLGQGHVEKLHFFKGASICSSCKNRLSARKIPKYDNHHDIDGWRMLAIELLSMAICDCDHYFLDYWSFDFWVKIAFVDGIDPDLVRDALKKGKFSNVKSGVDLVYFETQIKKSG